MTFSQTWMKIKNPKMTKTKLLDIQVQRQRAPIMMTESELWDKSQVLSFQVHEVKQHFCVVKSRVKRYLWSTDTQECYPCWVGRDVAFKIQQKLVWPWWTSLRLRMGTWRSHFLWIQAAIQDTKSQSASYQEMPRPSKVIMVLKTFKKRV